MNFKKDTWLIGLALFSMFFGAGNLILPPLLGFKAREDWLIVLIGFSITAVIIPILAIYAHAKLQGTLYDFGKKVSPKFSRVYCFLIYSIAIALPSPRTASVTHEIAISPFFSTSNVLTSTVYFALVLLFVLNRTKILNLLGRFLTPVIVTILIIVIVLSVINSNTQLESTLFSLPFIDGLLEGYQTFDAIGGVVVGAVLIVSLNLNKQLNFKSKKETIIKSGIIAGLGLFIIYGGLIVSGAVLSNNFDSNISRTDLLLGITNYTLGNIGSTFLSVLVALACFTTAVGIVTGAADYCRGLFKNSKKAYTITAILSCLLGVFIGAFDVSFIIHMALPVLMLIYPVTIILIFLNIMPEKYATTSTFKISVIVVLIFSIPDGLKFLLPENHIFFDYASHIPLTSNGLGWLLPSFLAFIISNLITKIK